MDAISCLKPKRPQSPGTGLRHPSFSLSASCSYISVSFKPVVSWKQLQSVWTEIRAITGKLPKPLHIKGPAVHPPEDWISLLEPNESHTLDHDAKILFILNMVLLSVMAAKILPVEDQRSLRCLNSEYNLGTFVANLYFCWSLRLHVLICFC